MNTLKSRLNDLFTKTGFRPADAARACKVKPPSVSDWLSGETKSLKAATLVALANFFDVHEEWINSGKGPKWRTAQAAARAGEVALFHATHEPDSPAYTIDSLKAWPLPSVTPEQFKLLPKDHRALIDAYARGVSDAWHKLSDHKSNGTDG